MDSAEFPKVWSADASLAKNIWKYSLQDDTGQLSVTQQGFSYQGETRSIDASWQSVRSVRLSKQVAPWALQAVLVGLTVALLLVGTLISGDFFSTLFVVASLLGFLFQWMRQAYGMSWLVVEYVPFDHPREVWLAEAVGWWGKLDGTQQIFEAFRARMPSDRRPDVTDSLSG